MERSGGQLLLYSKSKGPEVPLHLEKTLDQQSERGLALASSPVGRVTFCAAESENFPWHLRELMGGYNNEGGDGKAFFIG